MLSARSVIGFLIKTEQCTPLQWVRFGFWAILTRFFIIATGFTLHYRCGYNDYISQKTNIVKYVLWYILDSHCFKGNWNGNVCSVLWSTSYCILIMKTEYVYMDLDFWDIKIYLDIIYHELNMKTRYEQNRYILIFISKWNMISVQA